MRRYGIAPMVMGVCFGVACGGEGAPPDRGAQDEEFSRVEEVRLDDTEGTFADEDDVGEPPLPHDADEIGEDAWAEEDAKTDAEDHEEALNEIGDDIDDMDFEDVDLTYESASAFEEGATDWMDGEERSPVSCKKRIFVDFQAKAGLAQVAVEWRKTPAYSCWFPQRLEQENDWRGCFFDKDNHDDAGHHWYYDETSKEHGKTAEAGKVRACADTQAPRRYGYQLMRNDGGWRLVQAPRTAAFLAQLFQDEKDDINSLWYKRSVYRNNPKIQAHTRAGPGINIGADRSLAKIGQEVFKVCKKLRPRQHLFLYSDEPLRGLDPTKSWKDQSEASKRMALVTKALDRCTKRKVKDDSCYSKIDGCPADQVCAWNGIGYCCREPGQGLQPCMYDSHCPVGDVCAEGVGGQFGCMKAMCGAVTPPGSENDELRKCTFDVPKSADGDRDITFVAFGDPHAVDPSPQCPKKEGGDAGHAGIREALNSMVDGNHVWPMDAGFAKQGEAYGNVRGVLIVGDLTHTGSESRPAGKRVCREYTAYREGFGRCGDEGKLRFPVYEGYGNHDFPIVAGLGDPSYHPVVDYLARITKEHRPGAAADLYDDEDGSSGHYAWRWDDIWFVNLDLKPGDKREVVPKDNGTRTPMPHGSLDFLEGFLKHIPARSQIVIMSHYPLDTGRIADSERKAFCELIYAAQRGKKPFSSAKLAPDNPIVAFIHGHDHHAPEHGLFTCPSPYQSLKIRMFSAGAPLPGGKNNNNNLQFTVFRVGKSSLDAVGVKAPADNPTGEWASVYKRRFDVMNAPK